MIKNYDPNISFGEHTLRITLQRFDYKGHITTTMGGNCKGASLFSDITDTICSNYPKHITSDCDFEILEHDDEPIFSAMLMSDGGIPCGIDGDLDELEDMIVAIEIVDFKPEDR